MNLIQEGSHAAADWLGYKIRATKMPISLHVLGNGQMVTREVRRDTRLHEPTFQGAYSQQNWKYTDVVADLATIRNELMAQQEVAA